MKRREKKCFSSIIQCDFTPFFLVAQYRRDCWLRIHHHNQFLCLLLLTRNFKFLILNTTRKFSFTMNIIVCDHHVYVWSRFKCNHFPHPTNLTPCDHELITDNYSVAIKWICMQCDFTFNVYFAMGFPLQYLVYWFMLRLFKTSLYVVNFVFVATQMLTWFTKKKK